MMTAQRDETLAHDRTLAQQMTFAWQHRTHCGFFLRAEDIFKFARRTRELVKDLEEVAAEFEREPHGEAMARARNAQAKNRS